MEIQIILDSTTKILIILDKIFRNGLSENCFTLFGPFKHLWSLSLTLSLEKMC